MTHDAYLEAFVAKARQAAASDDPGRAIRALLQDSLQDRETMARVIAAQPEDEIMLFEDDTCSIWTCRFSPDMVMPPHEHRMPVHIAVYRGSEVQLLYRRDKDRLQHAGTRAVEAGETLRLGTDAVHAVTADGEIQSHAIHIYEGPLMQIDRALFDWTSGHEVAFTMENFHAMQKTRAELDDPS